MYINVYQIIKNQDLGPYNSLRHADNRKYFSGLKSKGNAHVSLGEGIGKHLEMFLLRKRYMISKLQYGQP